MQRSGGFAAGVGGAQSHAEVAALGRTADDASGRLRIDDQAGREVLDFQEVRVVRGSQLIGEIRPDSRGGEQRAGHDRPRQDRCDIRGDDNIVEVGAAVGVARGGRADAQAEGRGQIEGGAEGGRVFTGGEATDLRPRPALVRAALHDPRHLGVRAVAAVLEADRADAGKVGKHGQGGGATTLQPRRLGSDLEIVVQTADQRLGHVPTDTVKRHIPAGIAPLGRVLEICDIIDRDRHLPFDRAIVDRVGRREDHGAQGEAEGRQGSRFLENEGSGHASHSAGQRRGGE